MDLIGNRFQFGFFLLLFFALAQQEGKKQLLQWWLWPKFCFVFFFVAGTAVKAKWKQFRKKPRRRRSSDVIGYFTGWFILEKLVSGFFSQSHWSSFRLEWIFECFTLGKKTNHSRIVLLQLERFNSSTIPWVLRHYQNKIWQFDLFCLLVGRFTWNENSTDCMCGNGVFTWFK